MKRNETNKDQGLRLAIRHRSETPEKMTLSEDFTDGLMQRIGEQEPELKSKPEPKWHRPWLYAFIGAVAASILLLLAFHYVHGHMGTGKENVIAKQTELPEQSSKQESQSGEQRQGRQTEQQDNPAIVQEGVQTPMIAEEKSGKEKPTMVSQRPLAASVAHRISADVPMTDSLDYYIDKIERELAQVDESLYIERINKVIRADERLQRIVSSYILHTLDEDGRPQTADNMYNVKTGQDEK